MQHIWYNDLYNILLVQQKSRVWNAIGYLQQSAGWILKYDTLAE